MGPSNAAPYRVAIAQAFQNEGSDEQHPSWILELLREMECNKFRLDLPTESDVRKEQQRCIRWKQKAIKDKAHVPDYVELMLKVVDPLDDEYSRFIDAELECNPNLKPAAFMNKAVNYFSSRQKPLNDAELQKRVKRLFSSRKSALRRSLGLTASSAGVFRL